MPGHYVVEVSGPRGFADRTLPIRDLAPGEERRVDVRLQRAKPFAGFITDRQGSPLADLTVELTRGEFAGHDRSLGGDRWKAWIPDGNSTREVEVTRRDMVTQTGVDGSFTFTGQGTGRHTLLVRMSPHHFVPFHVDLPRDRPLLIQVPDSATLELTIRLPEDVPGDDVWVSILPPRSTLDPMEYSRHQWSDTAGTFLSSLPAARHRFALAPGPQRLRVLQSIARKTPGGGRATSTIEVHEENLELDPLAVASLELDLTACWPVPFEIDVPVDGAGVRHYPIGAQLVTLEEGERASEYTSVSAMDGMLRVHGWVAPGLYRLELSGAGSRWRSDEVLTVSRASVEPALAPPPLTSREVEFRDREGTPLANRWLLLWSAESERHIVTTDASGRVVLMRAEREVSVAAIPTSVDVLSVDAQELRAIRQSLQEQARFEFQRGPARLVVQLRE